MIIHNFFHVKKRIIKLKCGDYSAFVFFFDEFFCIFALKCVYEFFDIFVVFIFAAYDDNVGIRRVCAFYYTCVLSFFERECIGSRSKSGFYGVVAVYNGGVGLFQGTREHCRFKGFEYKAVRILVDVFFGAFKCGRIFKRNDVFGCQE